MQDLAPQYLSDLLEPLVEAKIPKRALKHEFVASHHTKGLTSDFDGVIRIFHCPISLGEELSGRRVATARFLRGVGGLLIR